jgi:branched-chain amino acid transport system permease protein
MDPNELKTILRLIYAGLSDGALLALIALGLVLVYKATDVINFAHGEFMLLGSYIGYQLLLWMEPNITSVSLLSVTAVIGMILAMIVVGILVERLVLRPLIGEPIISVIMVTIGLSNIIQAIVGGIWGKTPQRLPIDIIPFTGRFSIEIEGGGRPLILQQESLFVVFTMFVMLMLLITFFRYSKQGIAMRAAADDQQAAMSMGISIQTIFAITWSLAAVTAGIAGLLIADTTIGVSGDIPGVGLRAFPVIILGGLDSITGAIVGGLAIGLIETFASNYIDPSLKNAVPYLVLLIVLMIRPYGLFGQQVIERV